MAERRPQPRFGRAVLADARFCAANQGRPLAGKSAAGAALLALRLAWQTDAFAAQALYRASARTRSLGLPLLPAVLAWLAFRLAAIEIDPAAVLSPELYIVHGEIVIRGPVEAGPRTVISPWVEIVPDAAGAPVIGRGARIGTGARLLGAISLGAGVQVGANAVVRADVGDGATVVGDPARPTTGERAQLS